MSQTKIEKLTPEQEALIPVIRDKWRNLARIQYLCPSRRKVA